VSGPKGLAQNIKPLLVALTHTSILSVNFKPQSSTPSARVSASVVMLSEEISLLHVSVLRVHASSLLPLFRDLQLRALVNSIFGFVPLSSQPCSLFLELLCSSRLAVKSSYSLSR